MIGPFAKTVLALALGGALVSWVVGAIYYARCIAAIEGRDAGWTRVKALVSWPFVLKNLKGAASDHAAVVNKAIVAFLICIVVAVTTISLATNFNRISK